MDGGNFSFLLLIVLAYVLVKRGFDKIAFEGLPKLLFSVCYPALVLVTFTNVDADFTVEIILFITLFAVITGLGFYLLGRLALRKYQTAGRREIILFYLLVANTFVALPFIGFFFGSFGLSFVILFGVILDFFVWSLGYTQFAPRQNTKDTLKTIFNPCFITVIVGIIMALFSIPLPAIIAAPIHMLADTVIPLVLLLVGSLLAQNSHAFRSIDRDVILTVLARVVALPLLTFFVLRLLGTDFSLAFLSAFLVALPAPMLGIVLAKQFGKDVAFANALFVVSTPLFVVGCGVLFLLQSQGFFLF